jgi:rRNA maturation endonuclease Nob1
MKTLPDQNQSTRMCPGCGREISTVHAFCPYCGRPRGPADYGETPGSFRPLGERLCPGCGRQISEALRFCPYCGRPGPIGPAPIRADATTITKSTTSLSEPSSIISSKVTCVACGKEVPDGLNFCPMCGKSAPYSGIYPKVTDNPPVQMRKCFGCGRDIPIGLKFCPYCGRPDSAPVASEGGSISTTSPLEPKENIRLCVGCGREIREGLAFCPYCGKPTPGNAAIQSPSTIQKDSVQIDDKIKCMSCGRDFPGDLNFCPYCGRASIAEPQRTTSPDSSIQDVQPTQNPPEVRNGQSAMRLCIGCGKQIPEGLKFCPYCGKPAPIGPTQNENTTPLEPKTRVCPGCGMEISSVHKFCPKCGRPRD